MAEPIELPPYSRIALPTKQLFKQRLPGENFAFEYVDAASTDLRATFARVRAEQAKPARGLRAVTRR